jgi:hypothetical protein
MANKGRQCRPGGEFRDVGAFHHEMHGRKHPRQLELAALATRQHGVVAYRQLIALGFGRGAIDHLVAKRWLHSVHRGVYAVGHGAIGYLGRWMAGVLAGGAEAVLSHQNAGGLSDLRRMSSSAVHVTVPGRTRRGPRGVTIHRVRRLHPDERTVVNGIPVTSVSRTILDLAEVLSVRQLARVLEQAERLGSFDLRAVQAVMARNPGRHGLKPLKTALAEFGGSAPFVNSDWERDLYTFHRSRRAFEDDRLKYATLQLAGYLVLPLTKLDGEAAGLLSAAVAAR